MTEREGESNNEMSFVCCCHFDTFKAHLMRFSRGSKFLLPSITIKDVTILGVCAVGTERGLQDDNLRVYVLWTGEAQDGILAAPFFD